MCKQRRLDEYQDLLQKVSIFQNSNRSVDCLLCEITNYYILYFQEQQLVVSMGIKKRPKVTRVPTEEALQEFSAYIEQKLDEKVSYMLFLHANLHQHLEIVLVHHVCYLCI